MTSKADEWSSLQAKLFGVKLAPFNYSPCPEAEASTMPPGARKARAVPEAEVLTGVEERISDSRITSEAPLVASTSIELEGTAEHEPGSSQKRKRATKSSANTVLKKPRLQMTASIQAVPAVPAENNLKDSVRDGLTLISIGLNPGIMTGKTGHAYAHPTNRYWPTLHASGITPIQHKPAETHSLMDMYGIGHTNIIPSLATVGGNDLTKEDYIAGAKLLDEKVRRLRPQAVMVVGKGIWEEWFRYKKGRKMTKKDGFEYGWQDPDLWIGKKQGEWEGARSFVVTTTSGLSSSHTKEERIAIWKPMGDWFAPRREQWVKERNQREKEQDVDG